jgi:hypothetical protein
MGAGDRGQGTEDRGQRTQDTGQRKLGNKNGATGRSDIEGKAAREAASEWGRERVSMERQGEAT